jgi:predicted nucleotidyltransferase
MIALKDLCKEFNTREIPYLIIGGDAVNFHGYDRLSKDHDIWIENTEKTYKKIVDLLVDLHYIPNKNKIVYGNKWHERWELFKFSKVHKFHPAGEKKLDLFTKEIRKKQFLPCFQRAENVILDGVKYSFISLKDLIILKKRAGRDKDFLDIKELQQQRQTKKHHSIEKNSSPSI